MSAAERLLALWHWLIIGRQPSLRNDMDHGAGEHIGRIPTRVSSASRVSPRASPASRATAMATASAHAAADGPPGSRAAASLRGHVSIRRHWLSDTCTHTNTHKGRRRDESTSQRRSPDRGPGCDAPYTPLLKRRSSGSGAMVEALAAEEVDAALLAGEAPASQLIDCSQPRPQHGNDRERLLNSSLHAHLPLGCCCSAASPLAAVPTAFHP